MQNEGGGSIFERHPRATLAVFYVALLLVFLVAVELVLRHRMGMGDPVLFAEHPVCGYLLRPHQDKVRFGGAHFRVNNLGLRADRDWDGDPSGRVLFLGDSVTYGGNHLSNEELFSEVAVRNTPGLESGNGGIPGWGVENVAALVADERFLPASIYVTTFIEQDFYRGLQDGGRKPYLWFESPKYALREAFVYFWGIAKIRLHLAVRQFGEIDDAERVRKRAKVDRAAARLKEMDRLLASMDRPHLIYISPSRSEVLGDAAPDTIVARALNTHDLEAIYILDRLNLDGLSRDERASWFQDEYHLTPRGHAVWAGLMEADLRDLIGGHGPLSEAASGPEGKAT